MGPMKDIEELRQQAKSQEDLESIVRRAVGESWREPGESKEPALKDRLVEERRRREGLERRVRELTQENRHSRQQAEQAERFSQIRSRLQELGVKKVELAFRLVKDDVYRSEDGELYADRDGSSVPCGEYLAKFVSENPEFLPPRIAGGSGATGADRHEISPAGFDLDRIRPGMSREELAQAWREVARLAGQGATKW